MGKSSRVEILNRRRDMLRFDRLGVKPKEFSVKVACKYHVTQAAVVRDWSKRKEWMKTYFAVENTRGLALELFLEYEIDNEEISALIKKEKNTNKLIQLYYLKNKIREKRREFLLKIGAFEELKYDFENQAQEQLRRVFEKKYPWIKGNRSLCNSVMALEKLRGKLGVAELLEFESMFFSIFKGKGFVKPSVTLAVKKMAQQNQNCGR